MQGASFRFRFATRLLKNSPALSSSVRSTVQSYFSAISSSSGKAGWLLSTIRAGMNLEKSISKLFRRSWEESPPT